MHPVDALNRLGGVSDRKTLLRLTTRKRIRTAVRAGLIVKAGRRGFSLVTAKSALVAARKVNGITSHESPAEYHGWPIKLTPDRPNVTVHRHRKMSPAAHPTIKLWFRELDVDDHDGLATKKVRTVIDCAKDLPFDRALAVADSALRSGTVDSDDLLRAAERVRTRGRAQALRVAREANPFADNPFESVLRAIALDVRGLSVTPQVTIDEFGFTCRPDLVDEASRIVIEADSFEYHSSRKDLAKDIARYTNLVVRGWRVVRFSWEDVMFEPEYVRARLVALVEGPDSLAIPLISTRTAA
jgi:very-short-patch-repair endonuclease